MFGVDTTELLIVAVAALIFIGPKELPGAMRTLGRWIGGARAHARHFNAHSIGICYEGGLDADGNPADTRTKAQKQSLQNLLTSLCVDYPEAEILGHRDLPNVHKSCPCFSVQAWLNEIKFHI